MSASVKYLVIGATKEELSHFESELFSKEDFANHVCGVGMIEAANRTAQKLLQIDRSQHANLVVIFIGSVGSLNPETPILSGTCATSVSLFDYLEASRRSYFPKHVIPRSFFPGKNAIEKAKEKLSARAIFSPYYCPLSITKDSTVAKEIIEAGVISSISYAFENLELYGVANACNSFGVPWLAISTVTNYVGEKSHTEWLTNKERAAEKTAELVSLFVQ